MKVIFIGTSNFGLPSLELLKRDHELLAVLTMPDRPMGRKKILTPPPVKVWAAENGVKIFQPEKASSIQTELQALQPDVLVVAAYGQIIPDSLLNIAKFGAVNIHGSLLPKYRGASPIQAALLNGDTQTGVTLIKMDKQMDHGPILASRSLEISPTDDYISLHERLAQLGAVLLSETLPKFISGEIQPIPQNDSEATFVKLISRNDGKIDWTRPAKQILNKIRALNPEPGTWTTLDKKSVKILKAEEMKSGVIELPGKIYADGKDCIVKCGDYSIKLLLVQPEGKQPISGSDFLNGLKKLETKVLI